jgi:tetratricopeptide (TPR) repeat protein
LVILVVSGMLWAGHRSAQAAIDFLRKERYQEARVAFERARSADPLTASFAVDLATCYEQLGYLRRDAALLEQAGEQLQAALRLEPYNGVYHHEYGLFALRRGKLAEGLAHLERSTELYPNAAVFYGNLAQARILAGLRELGLGNRAAAEVHAARILELERELADRAAAVPAFVPEHWRLQVPDPALYLSAGQAYAIRGEFEEALDRLLAVHPAYSDEAALWVAVALEALGEPAGAELLVLLRMEAPELAEELMQLRTLLLPEKVER